MNAVFEPAGPLRGRLRVPADKSISHRAALLGDSPADDVADPIGGPLRAYADTASQLDGLIGRLAALCWRLPADSLPGQP